MWWVARRLRSRGELVPVVVGLAVITLGYLFDYLSARDLSVAVVYFFAVGFMAWSGGLRAGVIGAVAAGVAEGIDAFGEADPSSVVVWNSLTTLLVLAGFVVVVDLLRRALDRAESQARFDALTGAANLLACQERGEIELARLERLGGQLSVAFLDLDSLKELNDRAGHPAGDAALVHLVRTAQETLRPTDLLARVGGDEFVLLLPDTDSDEAITVTRRIQDQLRDTVGEESLSITVGLVTWRHPPENTEELFVEADALMYEAKRRRGECFASRIVG
jgi:diguanylate cyclase (GGDEF)-like protein